MNTSFLRSDPFRFFKTIGFIVLFFISVTTSAQKNDNLTFEKYKQYIIENAIGNYNGQINIEKDIFGNTVIKDDRGNVLCVVKKDVFGNLAVEDGQGRTLRKIKKDVFGDTVIEGEWGFRQQKIRKNIFGDTVIEDDRGNAVRKIKKDIFGNIIVEDGRGNQVYAEKKDIFDNTVIEGERGVTKLKIEKDIFGNTTIGGVYNEQLHRLVMQSFIDNFLADKNFNSSDKRSLTVKDERGNVVRKVEKDIFGHFILRDGRNNAIRTIRKDIFGNIEVLDDKRNAIIKVEKEAINDLYLTPTYNEWYDLDEFIVNSLLRKILSRGAID